MQLLGEVVGTTQYLDGMKLSLQEVGVPLFVLNHALKLYNLAAGKPQHGR